MSRVVVLAGGAPHAHDFAATGAAIAARVAGRGHDVHVVDDPDRAAAGLGDDVDALVVDGLWWQMVGAAYDAWRDEHAYSPTPATRSAVTGFVRDGGGLLAVHTSTICFDDWPQWGSVLGGAWEWGVSSHPPYGPVSVRIVGDHPVVDGLPAVIELHDEVYGDLDISADVEVLAVAKRSADDADQPMVWAHRFGAGRVLVDVLGHDVASIDQPDHARLLVQGVEWVTGAR